MGSDRVSLPSVIDFFRFDNLEQQCDNDEYGARFEDATRFFVRFPSLGCTTMYRAQVRRFLETE
jgi:hypothetical protein